MIYQVCACRLVNINIYKYIMYIYIYMQLILLFFRSPKSTAAAFSLLQPPSFGQENETRPVSCIETTSESAVDSRSPFFCAASQPVTSDVSLLVIQEWNERCRTMSQSHNMQVKSTYLFRNQCISCKLVDRRLLAITSGHQKCHSVQALGKSSYTLW